MSIPAELAADVIAFRRELHAHPELDLELPQTQAAVLGRLAGIEGLEVSTGEGMSSVVAVLRGEAPLPEGTRRPVVLLRGDMDGLPVTEETGLPYAPDPAGTMHACGHDLHTAGLYGALAYLGQRRGELVADVIGMFQPAEETDGGALRMIEQGLLEAAGPRADAAFALHVYSAKYEHGRFVSRPGSIQAGCDDLIVTVRGRGGHGSVPHLSQDPVPVAAEMVLGLQSLVTRQFDAFDPVVATVGHLTAGTASNIVPDTATLSITLRTFSAGSRARLIPAVERLVRGIADAHGLGVDVRPDCEFPVTVNDPAEVDYARGVIEGLFGSEAYEELPAPEPGSEDFSEVLLRVPGAYILLGAVPPGQDPHTAPTNHSPLAVFDDAVLPRAVEALAGLALGKGPVAL
ncbi:amidohydrolase [Galactobacter valiniphilus]|uniref:Amidohydrolase n=1 Tax=Galactobacter valiniphilus TaxID=2676122 RepID=A0A399J6I1_9MICC|nr:M20 family metallopeptidase [Galactobacter valiniphilus]RII41075.1 amidohydrolase [Galactobacter valiniphilus]